MGMIYPDIIKVLERLTKDQKDAIEMIVGSPCLYHKYGLPSILIDQLGFDGLYSMLSAPEEERLQTLATFYVYPLLAAATGISEPSSITLFPRMISAIWWLLGKPYEGITRRAWKFDGCIYRAKVAPWNQCNQFDITALVWDEDRLISWGYFPPIDVDWSEDSSNDCWIFGCGYGLVDIPAQGVSDVLGKILARATEEFEFGNEVQLE
ncbi:hypothetical protein ABW20_dc0109530 [Dactylellina cionopaga]|nr:hypothetical protein ABW20_dc0109530 [Dactylellina cionopaga]